MLIEKEIRSHQEEMERVRTPFKILHVFCFLGALAVDAYIARGFFSFFFSSPVSLHGTEKKRRERNSHARQNVARTCVEAASSDLRWNKSNTTLVGNVCHARDLFDWRRWGTEVGVCGISGIESIYPISPAKSELRQLELSATAV